MKKGLALAALLLPLTVAGCAHRVVVYAAPPRRLTSMKLRVRGSTTDLKLRAATLRIVCRRAWRSIPSSATLRCRRRPWKIIGMASAKVIRRFCIAMRRRGIRAGAPGLKLTLFLWRQRYG